MVSGETYNDNSVSQEQNVDSHVVMIDGMACQKVLNDKKNVNHKNEHQLISYSCSDWISSSNKS
jgi:hypothetical protein